MFLFFLTLFSKKLNAQQLPLFSQYREYHSIINPAMVSTDFILNTYRYTFGASVRQQWVNIDRAPSTQILRGEWVAQPGESFTFITGGHLANDRVGGIGSTSFTGRIAGFFSSNPKNDGFSAGLNVGIGQFRFNSSDRNAIDPSDPLYGLNVRKPYLDLSLGVFGYRSLTGNEDNILSGGFSIPQVFNPDITLNPSKTATFKFSPHYYATVGYFTFLSNESFLELSAWGRYVKAAKPQVSLNLRYQLQEYLWLGMGYGTQKVLHTEVGMYIGRLGDWISSDLKIGYSFDYGLGSVFNFGSGHELNLVFLFQ